MGEVKGSKKAGRNRRQRNMAMSAYVRGVIDFGTYQKRAGVKPAGLKRTVSIKQKGGAKK